MIAKSVKTKIKDIVGFLLSGFKFLFISGFLWLIVIAILAIVIGNYSGKWTIGTTFEEWWGSISSSEVIDGKFSATDPKTCWSCTIFARLFDLMGVMAVKLYVYIADIAWVLIWAGLAVWILNYVYKNTILEQSNDVVKMLKEIGMKVVVIGVISAGFFYTTNEEINHKYLKSMANTIFENTAVPVLKMGVGVSGEILQTNICDKLYYPEMTESDNILSKELKNDMICFMNTVSVVFFSAMKAGSNMVSMALKSFVAHPASNAKNLPDIFAGMAIIIIFFIMYATIPFTLIDIVFTVGILIAFIPLFLASYAYSDVGKVKGFANKGISSIWHMAFYIIMYSLFLGIVYSGFVYIADMYYPGPLDNFTYLFPDFVYSDMVNGETANIMLSKAFQSCYDAANGSVSKIQSCLVSSNMQLNFPSLENPGGSFLPMFTYGILSLMIMYSGLESYAKLVDGPLLHIGKAAKNICESGIKKLAGGFRELAGFVKNKNLNKLITEDEEIAKMADDLASRAEDNDQGDNS